MVLTKDLLKVRKLYSAIENFYKKNPLALVSISILFGVLSKLITPLFFLFIPAILPIKKGYILATVSSLSYLYTLFLYPSLPNIKDRNIEGVIKIKSKRAYRSYSSGFIYSGTLKNFKIIGDKKTYRKIPFILYLKKKDAISADYTYKIKAIANNKKNHLLKLKAIKIVPIKRSSTTLEKRSLIKNILTKKIKKDIKIKDSAHILSAILTGSLQGRFLRFSIQRTGMQHLIATSGFHFGIIITLFSFLLKRLKPNIKIALLLLITSIYFFYIGTTPSIQRAYITASIALAAKLLKRENAAINTLGIALIIELILDPLNIFNIGMQFSFLSVAAIFLIYPHLRELLSLFMKKRGAQDIKKLKLPSKIGAFFINFLRESMALTLSINIVIVPLLLYHFQRFPMISLVYNIFIPPLFSISILLLIITVPFLFIFPKLSLFLNIINGYFTKFLIDLITNPPKTLEFFIRAQSLPKIFIATYLILIFLFFIFIKSRPKRVELFDYF